MGFKASSGRDTGRADTPETWDSHCAGRPHQNERCSEVPMRACRYLLTVGLLLAGLPAAAKTPATNVRPVLR